MRVEPYVPPHERLQPPLGDLLEACGCGGLEPCEDVLCGTFCHQYGPEQLWPELLPWRARERAEEFAKVKLLEDDWVDWSQYLQELHELQQFGDLWW